MGEGGFDIVHAHEPIVPGPGTAALRHTRGITVATFHTRSERAVSYPIRGGRRKRYGSRIDALLATSPRAAELAGALYAGDYELVPDPVSPRFAPAAKRSGSLVAEWTSEGRSVARALIRMVADRPDAELTLVWDRRGRRPMRPHVPAAGARPRAHGRHRRRRRPRRAAGDGRGVRVRPRRRRRGWPGRRAPAAAWS